MVILSYGSVVHLTPKTAKAKGIVGGWGTEWMVLLIQPDAVGLVSLKDADEDSGRWVKRSGDPDFDISSTGRITARAVDFLPTGVMAHKSMEQWLSSKRPSA